jgi:glycosyltransferase involved in cell wall biosynthesis
VRYFIPQAEALERVDESVVLAHNAPALPALLAGTQHSVVLYAHNDILRTVSSREAQKTLAGVAAIVCVSAFLAEQTAARLPSSLAQRVHAVGNGVDCAQFTPGNTARNERLRVLFVGRMIPQKGADLLLKAVALLRRDDLELVLVGSRGFDRDAPLTRYERRLRELAERCSAAVRFEPFVARDRLPELFRQADVLVVPSRWDEPSGLTVSEGQASGLPVIASRVGGIPEVVGSAGMLVDAEAGAFAEAIAALADDTALRRRMAQEARRHAERHDWAWSWSGLRRVLGGL